METLISSPPRTMIEVYKSLPEGTPVQLIENNIVMTPTPAYRHQEIQSDIIKALFLFLDKNPLGKLLVAPLDVYFNDENVLQPDIMFISNDKMDIIHNDGLHGSPDLIIEILSPSTAKYDLNQKKAVYECSGVKEYWIVDPENKEAQGYFMKNGIYGNALFLKSKIHFGLLDLEIVF